MQKTRTHRDWGAEVGVHQRALKHGFIFIKNVDISSLEELLKRKEHQVIQKTQAVAVLAEAEVVALMDGFVLGTCCSRFCFLSWMPSSSLLRLISSGFSALFL